MIEYLMQINTLFLSFDNWIEDKLKKKKKHSAEVKICGKKKYWRKITTQNSGL